MEPTRQEKSRLPGRGRRLTTKTVQSYHTSPAPRNMPSLGLVIRMGLERYRSDLLTFHLTPERSRLVEAVEMLLDADRAAGGGR